jgi:hypothetical protein
MIGGCQSSSCPATTCSYWDLLSGADSPGNRMVRLAAAMKAAVIERFKLQSAHNIASPIEGIHRLIGLEFHCLFRVEANL